MFELLHSLTTPGLQQFSSLCRERFEALPPVHRFQQIAGPLVGDKLNVSVENLVAGGWTLRQLADLADAVVGARQSIGSADALFDLVLSGPDVPGIPTRDTGAVMHALLAEARDEVLLVGYAIHNAQHIFEPLAQRMAANPHLRVVCCLDIRRVWNDASHTTEIVKRFGDEFTRRHWPWAPRPKIYFDPRSLEPNGPQRSSLHAKCVVVDRSAALVTSANFTDAAQERNIECGIVVRHGPLVERIALYFHALCNLGHFSECATSDYQT